MSEEENANKTLDEVNFRMNFNRQNLKQVLKEVHGMSDEAAETFVDKYLKGKLLTE